MIVWFYIYIIALIMFYTIFYYVIPKRIVKKKYVKETYDKGKKITYVGDEIHILYEPNDNEYIKEYALMKNKTTKKVLLKCKLALNVMSIEYEVFLFNRNSKCYHAIYVTNTSDNEGYTEEVSLPKNVNYVYLNVKKVNENVVDKNTIVNKISKGFIFSYVFITSVIFLGALIAGGFFALHVIGDVFIEQIINDLLAMIISLCVLVVIDIINAIILYRKFFLNYFRRMK